ncbi:helix-turn-helix domain-containing protein [Methylobacterium fujisawaense]|uniref:helix-turn-helix domain-containing protein n=1 Tax=Methylobacterium fujisawaense TaxID=107400 RepID=UPI00370088FD
MLYQPRPAPHVEAEALTIEEACAASGLGTTYLYKAMAKGELRARKAGRRTIIMRDDLRSFLAALPAFQSEASGARAA